MRQLMVACLLALLIGVLLYHTQWLNLRFGLTVLLAGQAGVVLALVVRIFQLSRQASEAAVSAWFEQEVLFVRRLAAFDAVSQMAGFLALGWEFWKATGNFWISVAVGLVYPVSAYLGISRRKTREAVRRLRAERTAPHALVRFRGS